MRERYSFLFSVLLVIVLSGCVSSKSNDTLSVTDKKSQTKEKYVYVEYTPEVQVASSAYTESELRQIRREHRIQEHREIEQKRREQRIQNQLEQEKRQVQYQLEEERQREQQLHCSMNGYDPRYGNQRNNPKWKGGNPYPDCNRNGYIPRHIW